MDLCWAVYMHNLIMLTAVTCHEITFLVGVVRDISICMFSTLN